MNWRTMKCERSLLTVAGLVLVVSTAVTVSDARGQSGLLTETPQAMAPMDVTGYWGDGDNRGLARAHDHASERRISGASSQ